MTGCYQVTSQTRGGSRTFYLAAKDEEEREAWVTALSAAIAVCIRNSARSILMSPEWTFFRG